MREKKEGERGCLGHLVKAAQKGDVNFSKRAILCNKVFSKSALFILRDLIASSGGLLCKQKITNVK